jgi:hypothetical protein
MPEPIPPDLLSPAGVTLDAQPASTKPKRRRNSHPARPSEAVRALVSRSRRERAPTLAAARVSTAAG